MQVRFIDALRDKAISAVTGKVFVYIGFSDEKIWGYVSHWGERPDGTIFAMIIWENCEFSITYDSNMIQATHNDMDFGIGGRTIFYTETEGPRHTLILSRRANFLRTRPKPETINWIKEGF